MADNLMRYSWYHGGISRVEAERILTGQRPGLFLVRGSATCLGDLVLSVSESGKVSHYIMNNLKGAYKIGDQTFDDLPSIVEFYKRHFLDTTTLGEPAVRPGAETAPAAAPSSTEPHRVRAKFNFPGNDADDLPFKRGDILTVLNKEQEDQWWIAKDSAGREGMIPVPYVEAYPAANPAPNPVPQRGSFPSTRPPGGDRIQPRISHNPGGTLTYAQPSGTPAQRDQSSLPIVPANCTTPFFVEAVQDRNPNIYDHTMLKFEKGERLEVLNMKDDGTWEGRLSNGRKGLFPFSYVKLLDMGNGESNWNGTTR